MKIAKRTAAAVTALVVTGAAAAPVLTDFASYISYQVSAEDTAPAYSLTVDKALINADSLKTLKSYMYDGLLDAGIVNKDVEAGKYDNRKVAEVKFSIDENPGLWGAQIYFSYDKELVFAGCKKYESKSVSNYKTITDDNLTVNADTSKLVVLFNKDGVNITETGEFVTLLFVLPENAALDHEYEIGFLEKTKNLITPWTDDIKPGCIFNPGYIKLTAGAAVAPVTTVTTTEKLPVTTLVPPVNSTPATTTAKVTEAPVTSASVTTTALQVPAETTTTVTSPAAVTPPPTANPTAAPVPAENKIQIKLSDAKVKAGQEAEISVEALNVGAGFSAVQFNYEMDSRFTLTDGVSELGKWTLGTTEKAAQFLEKNGNNIKTDGSFGELYIKIPAGTPAGKYPVKISGFKGSVFDETVRKQRALTDDNFVSEVAYITVVEDVTVEITLPTDKEPLSPGISQSIQIGNPVTLTGDADIKIDVPVQKLAYTEDKKQIEMKVNLSDYDASKAGFNFAGFAFDLPEGFSIAGVKSSVSAVPVIYNSESDYSSTEKSYFETIVKSAKFGTNCKCIKFESIDTSKLSGSDELFTVVINVPDKAEFVNNIGVAAAFGNVTGSTDNGITITPIITKAGPYTVCNTKIYTGLRGDVNLDNVVNLFDATTIQKELLSLQADEESILADLVRVKNPDENILELSRFLGDVDGSSGKSFQLFDATYLKKALLEKESEEESSITEQIWNTVLKKNK